MAIVAYKTWASGDILTAADMNQYVRDNGMWLAADISTNIAHAKPTFRFTTLASQTGIASGDALVFDSFRGNLTGGITNTGSQITLPASGAYGFYLIGANLRFNASGWAAGAVFAVQFRVNGTDSRAAADVLPYEAAGSKNHYVNLVTATQLANSDFFELVASFTTLTSVDLLSGSNYSPDVWGCWLGKAA